MERDGLFSSASETTPEEERDLLLYSKYANSVQRVVSLPACRFVGYFEVHEVRSVTRDDGERSVDAFVQHMGGMGVTTDADHLPNLSPSTSTPLA